MRVRLNINYSSAAQQRAFRAVQSGDTRTLLLRGGSGSGKTYIAMLGVLFRALRFSNTEHYLLKTDLKVLRASFESSVLSWLRGSGWAESQSRRKNVSYFWDDAKSELRMANGSVLYLRPIRSPRPQNSRGDSALLGMNAETVYVDEATTVSFDWYTFFETRTRSAHGCPPLLLLTENLDARSWSYSYFDQRLNPNTGEPLTPEQVDQSRVLRIEAWENVLQDTRYLELLKASGNAERFYYSRPDGTADYGRIYPYVVEPARPRLFYVYGVDIGYNARTAVVQVGFGGDFTTTIRQLAYMQGCTHDDFLNIVDTIIDVHNRMRYVVENSLSLPLQGHLRDLQLVPVIVVDCARTDLIKEWNQHYNERRMRETGQRTAFFVPSKKGEQKYYSIERIKRFRQCVDPSARNYISEIRDYRYDKSPNVEERVPDGHDDLLDASLYAHRYILEELMPRHPELIMYGPTQKAMQAEFDKMDFSKCYTR